MAVLATTALEQAVLEPGRSRGLALASTLGVMTWLAVAYPEAERVGVLRIPTTRGDRLFISLILAAVIHLLWIAFAGTEPIPN